MIILKIKKKIHYRFLVIEKALHDIFKGKRDIVILDDIFPHLLSGFRIAEINYYLQNIPKVDVYSTTNAFKYLNEFRNFEEVKKEYSLLYPKYQNNVFKYEEQKIKAKLIYIVFLHNAHFFLPIINKYKAPFIFTLYPGGGFQLNQANSDAMLKEVLTNKYFKKVIVTTRTTYEYLLDKNFCREDQIEFIYGVVTQTNIFENNKEVKRKYLKNKTTFDICFVAHKYTPQGRDKGYDIFIKVAKELSKIHNNFKFHIVGGFNQDDIDITDIKDKVVFYQTLKTHEFTSFYTDIDIILSPNSSFLLTPGGFDGFPTGACIEAGVNGVALFAADDLNQNIKFKNGEEIEIINTNSNAITEKILFYYANPEKLYSLALNGKLKIQQTYNLEVQMKPRINLLVDALNKTN